MSKPSIEEILVIRPNLRPRIYAYSIADQAHRASVHKRPEQAPPAVANQPTPGWLQPTDGGARLAPGAEYGLYVLPHYLTKAVVVERSTRAVLGPGDIAAYFELHIEQSLVLESANVPIGIVQAITGIRQYRVVYTGT